MNDDLFAPLEALASARRTPSPRCAPSIAQDDGPVDRRITTNRRISLTALLPSEVDMVSVRPTISGIIISTDIGGGVLVTIHMVAGRREVWLRGRDVRRLLPAALVPRRDRRRRLRSVPVEVYRRQLPDRGVELEIVPRGERRSL
ncbi:MAG: hypothetical protein ACYCTL_05940 [Acidimicrobiales bacterium]